MNAFIDGNELIRLKELCKASRRKLGYSNQNIADLIAEKFNLPEFSVNTVNNFFSDRAKATTAFTVGVICSVLDVSIDEVFQITGVVAGEEREAMRRQLTDLEQDVKLANKEIDKLELIIREKDTRLKQAHDALAHYRKVASEDRKRVPMWAFVVLLAVVVILVLVITAYLVIYDLSNSGYGLFR